MRWVYPLLFGSLRSVDGGDRVVGLFRSADEAGRFLRDVLERDGFDPKDARSWSGYRLEEWDLDRFLDPRVIDIPGRPSMDGRPVRRRSN